MLFLFEDGSVAFVVEDGLAGNATVIRFAALKVLHVNVAGSRTVAIVRRLAVRVECRGENSSEEGVEGFAERR